jgi:hypothetical protein
MPNPPNRAVRVYNLIEFHTYILSKSIILDNRAATHLVNSANQLVPRTFCPADSTNIVEAGT